MSVTLMFQRTKASIDTVELDASLSETHHTAIEVTEHPVEQGIDISDHKRRKPDELTIEGLVTNDPLPDPATPRLPDTFKVPRLTLSDGEDNTEGGTLDYRYTSEFQAERAGSAYQDLLALADTKQLISVVTSLRTYQNMVMTDLSVPRDATSGQALKFTAQFKEIRIVMNATVLIKSKNKNANGKKNLNKKVTPPVTGQAAPAESESVLRAAVHSDPKAAMGALVAKAKAFVGGGP